MAEPVRNQLERAQEILDLLSTEEWVTSDTIAGLVGQSSKSSKRYIAALREMGYEIEAARGKGYRLEGELVEGRLRLSEEETLTLFFSLERGAADFPKDIGERLRRRLETMLSKGRRQQARTPNSDNNGQRAPYFQDFDCLRAISKAQATQRLLRVSYQGLKDTQPRRRTVQPLKTVATPKGWVLEVWDVEEDKEKSFRLDRISDAICLSDPFVARDPQVQIDHHPWDFGQHSLQVELRVRPDLARWLSENPEHPSQTISELEDGEFRAQYSVRCPGKFLDWLIGLRGFELLGPPQLQTALRERAETLWKSLGTLNVPWEVSAG